MARNAIGPAPQAITKDSDVEQSEVAGCYLILYISASYTWQELSVCDVLTSSTHTDGVVGIDSICRLVCRKANSGPGQPHNTDSCSCMTSTVLAEVFSLSLYRCQVLMAMFGGAHVV